MQKKSIWTIIVRFLLVAFVTLNAILPIPVEAQSAPASSQIEKKGGGLTDPFRPLSNIANEPTELQESVTDSKQTQPVSLILEATPKTLKPNGKVDIAWVIDGLATNELQGLTLTLSIPQEFTPAKDEQAFFDGETHSFIIPLTGLSDEVKVISPTIPAQDTYFNAVVKDVDDNPIASADLIVPLHKKFELGRSGGEISARNGNVQVKFDREVFKNIPQGVEIEFGTPSDAGALQSSFSGKPFEIKARNKGNNAEITDFSSNSVEIEIALSEFGYGDAKNNEVILYWYNPENGSWYGMSSWVDEKTNTLHALTDHFSIFDLGEYNWEASKVPNVNSFQIANFTGAATYSYPIEVPAGSGGLQPSLNLNYNSQIVDHATTWSQGGWTGMGWSLDTGYIELNTHNTEDTAGYSYMLHVNGISAEIIPTADGYRAADENFLKIASGGPVWTVWDKQGNVYEFGHLTTIRFPSGCSGLYEQTTRWSLTKVRNAFGKELNFTYEDETKNVCSGAATTDTATYPTLIAYPDGRTRVRFVRENRPDYEMSYVYDDVHHSFERTRLDQIIIERNTDGDATFETIIRKYDLNYSNSAIWPNATAPSALISITEYGAGGTTALPATTFTYSDLMHLTQANNGYGGAVSFAYEPWYFPTARASYFLGFGEFGVSPSAATIAGYVKPVKPGGAFLIEGFGTKPLQAFEVWMFNDYIYQRSPAGYSYTGGYFILPADSTNNVKFLYYNADEGRYGNYISGRVHLFTTIYRVTTKTIQDGNGHAYPYIYTYTGAAVNDDAHSFASATNTSYTEKYSEFRGHASVTETAPDGTQSVTYFYQDDVYRGRISSTATFAGEKKRSETISSYSYIELPGLDLSYKKIPRYWVRQDSAENRLYNNDGVTYNATKTKYYYEPTYGNLIKAEDYSWVNSDWSRFKITNTFYTILNNGTKYLTLPSVIDVRRGDDTYSTAEILYLYDNHNLHTDAPTSGLLTGTRTYMDSSGNFNQINYGYDTWGNRTNETIYSSYGVWNSAPTSGGRTITTAYDPVFHAYPVSQTTPPVAGGAGLTTSWIYDYDLNGVQDYFLGLPTSEIAPTGTTSAQYDAFGRIIKLIRPGDTSNSPTISVSYSNGFPFTVTKIQKVDNYSNFVTQQVYDGMGRQTRVVSGGSIADTVYQSPTVTKQSAPYLPGGTAYYTTTEVNLSSNTSKVTSPDGTFISTLVNGLTTTVTDANGNATVSVKDVWGRVIQVTPPTGPGVEYTYDQFGRMKTATRGGVTTTITYDYAGRKIAMSDPDMGNWTYEYDALGNLIKQRDAKNQYVCLYYDNLNRLDGKKYTSDGNCSSPTSLAVDYSYNAATGLRDGMTDDSGSTAWSYDARGRLTSETKTISGLTFITSWTYNSADLPVSMTYPDNEVLTYGYNSRMLLNTVTSSLNGTTYVSSSDYDEAGRLNSRLFGSGTTQAFGYYAWDEKVNNVGQGGRLKSITAGTFQNLNYVYDSNGNIKTITDSIVGESQSFGYDTLNRLTDSTVANGPAPYSETYTYDNTTGNLVSNGISQLVYNDPLHIHAATNAGENTYGYDANGNMTDRNVVDPSTGSGQAFDLAYDVENRLINVTQGGQAQVPQTDTISFDHGGGGSYFAMPVLQTGDTPTPTPAPPSDLIFADGFESGDFSAWDWTNTDGGDLSVTSQAAASGNYGAQALIDDNHEMKIYDELPNSELHYSARFYFDPNSVQISSNGGVNLVGVSTGTTWAMCLYLEQQGAYYSLTLCGLDDSDEWFETSSILIADEWQAIELEWKSSTAPGADNGYIRLYVGDQLAGAIENLDNDAKSISDITLAVDDSFTASGAIYFDLFESRKGSHIGLDPNGPAVNPVPFRPDVIFADDFEGGSLSSWNPLLTTLDGGDLSITVSAAYQDNFGLQALIDDTIILKAVDSSPADDTRYRSRFYFNPNSLVMGNNTSHFIFDGFTTYYNAALFRLELFYESGTYKLRPRVLKDDWGYTNGSKYAISNTWHVVEIDWSAATAPGANDGYFSLWIDDSLIGTISNVDNDSDIHRLDEVRLGATEGLDATTSGLMLFDNFEARRVSYIGPLSSTATSTPTSTSTNTPSPTPVGPTFTFTPSKTATASNTPTITQTPSKTSTPTKTMTPTATPAQLPYGGSARAIPGTVQAEDFDTGGEGVAYHDTTTSNQGGAYRTSERVDIESTSDTGGGYNVGYIKAGEWTEYTINVASAGTYNLGLRLANSASGGSMHLEVDGVNVSGSVAVPNTGGYQTWQTVSVNNISLTAGLHIVRLSFDTNSTNSYVGNINYFSFVSSTPTSTPTSTSTFTPSKTNTPANTNTPTATFTPSNTPTMTFTSTETPIPTSTYTPTVTPTPTQIPSGVGMYDDSSPKWVYSGAWTSASTPGTYGNTIHYSGTVGDSASFTFSGTQFILRFTQYTNRGSIKVYVDDSLVTTINANGNSQLQKMYISPIYTSGVHTVRLEHAGGGTYIDVDALEILDGISHGTGLYDDTSPGWMYSGLWTPGTASNGPYNNTIMYSGVVGDSASFTFSGTQFALKYTVYTNRGNIGVYLDGNLLATINATGALQWQKTYTSPVFSAGTHTVQLVHAGGGEYIDVDAIEILQTGYPGAGIYDDGHFNWIYSGAWIPGTTAIGPYNNAITYSGTTGDSASFTFSGTQFALKYTVYTNRGNIGVYLDGNLLTTLNANGALQWQKTYTSPVFSAGTHTVRIVHAGGGTYIDVDAIQILDGVPSLGTYDDANTNWIYNGVWTAFTGLTGPYNTTLYRSETVGDSASFTFDGTQFALKYTQNTNRGNMSVYIDGSLIATINQNGTLQYQTTYTSPLLSPGTHTLRVQHAGGGTYVDVDSIQILSSGPPPTPTITPTNPPVPTEPPSGVFSNAQFTYDGDGRRVKSVLTTNLGATTTYFVGSHYEVTDGGVTKYYYAGATRIAMRKNGTLYYLLGDHLGSTGIVTFENGNLLSQTKYKAWGEVRHQSGPSLTAYTYTGQFSYTGSFGLMFYNARWYDPSLGRFAQADSIVPPGVQGYDRYAYTSNNPVRYTDPSGHCSTDVNFLMPGISMLVSCIKDIAEAVSAYSDGERDAVQLAAKATGFDDWAQKTGNRINELNSNVSTVFSNAPVSERILPAIDVGWTAVSTAATLVGIGQTAAAINNTSSISVGTNIPKYPNGTAFSGAYDSATGNMAFRPSTSNLPRPDGWVPRNGGHLIVADDLIAQGSNFQNLHGFTVKSTSPRNLSLISWDSSILNLQHGGRTASSTIQREVIDRLVHGGWSVK